SLNKPSRFFTIHKDKIIAPLSVLKRVGGSAIDELVEQGPFDTVDDFITKVPGNKVNIGHFSALIKGRAADWFMDESLPDGEARLKFMDEYVKKRKCRAFAEDMLDVSPMSIFLQERETNKCFNKTLLNDKDILGVTLMSRPEFVPTGRKGVPFINGRI